MRSCLWTRVLVLLSLLAAAHSEAPQESGILRLTHRYSGREGSSKRNGFRGMSREYAYLLMDHDRTRKGRFLADAVDGVDFSLGGTADPNTGGLYFTQIGLGNPVKHYIVQVDTGSDVLWVNCKPCSGCPRRSELNIPLTMYDPSASTTTSSVACSDPLCVAGRRVAEASCSQSNMCQYVFQYGDGSTSAGYYVRDSMQYTVMGPNGASNATSKVLFGCSINQTGDLSSSQQAVDGIIGFGQLELSVPNQIASQQNIPRVFSHCLEGEGAGGGILVIGAVNESGIVYTPLVPNSTHYNVVLRSISVSSNKLPIDQENFSSNDDSGVILDSGTTLAYLPSGAYNVFVQAMRDASSATPVRFTGLDTQCFLLTGRVGDAFPKVTLEFAGGATMELGPENYLMFMQSTSTSGAGTSGDIWCLGWQSSSSSAGPKDGGQLTILGDIVLKDKLVVYDLENSRIGWVNYNCSDKVHVGGQSVFATHLNTNNVGASLKLSDTLFRRLITTLVIFFCIFGRH